MADPIRLVGRPDLQRKENNKLFYEGDFRSPERGATLLQKAGMAAAVVGIAIQLLSPETIFA